MSEKELPRRLRRSLRKNETHTHTHHKCTNKNKGRNGTLEKRDLRNDSVKTSHKQPFRLSDKIHSGRLKIKQTDGHALPLKQHLEYPLAVKIVTEREQQRVAESNLRREGPNANHPHRHPLNTMAGGQVRGWRSRGNIMKINPRLLQANFWSVSDEPPNVATRAVSENSSSCTRHLQLSSHLQLDSQQCLSRLQQLFSAHRSTGLRFVLVPQRHSVTL